MIKVELLTLGSCFQSNCYIGVNENNEAFAVDIGGEASVLLRYLESNGIVLKKIFLTHGHYDHTRGVAETAEKTGAEVYIHADDAVMLTDADASLSRFVGADRFNAIEKYNIVNDGDTIDFCGNSVRVLHTPGHTRGGVCYIIDDMIFSGDTLFCGSIGRTDFPGSSFNDMRISLQKLVRLSEEKDYEVFPGHNEITKLRHETEYNIYLR